MFPIGLHLCEALNFIRSFPLNLGIKILARLEEPDVNASLIEVYEMQTDIITGIVFPVTIDGKIYRFKETYMVFGNL